MKNKKKCKYKKTQKKNKQSKSEEQKQEGKGIGFTLFEVAILLTILGIIGNFIYMIIYWREAADSAKQLGFLGCTGVIIGVILFRKLIDIIFNKLFD